MVNLVIFVSVTTCNVNAMFQSSNHYSLTCSTLTGCVKVSIRRERGKGEQKAYLALALLFMPHFCPKAAILFISTNKLTTSGQFFSICRVLIFEGLPIPFQWKSVDPGLWHWNWPVIHGANRLWHLGIRVTLPIQPQL